MSYRIITNSREYGAGGHAVGKELSKNLGIALFDSEIIQKVAIESGLSEKYIAEKEPCVIIGRCADFILKERNDVLDVFLHASYEERIKRLVSENVELGKKPEKFLHDRDCRRSSYVHFYTDMKWGESRNYDITLDTGKFGIKKCAELIEDIYKS